MVKDIKADNERVGEKYGVYIETFPKMWNQWEDEGKEWQEWK